MVDNMACSMLNGIRNSMGHKLKLNINMYPKEYQYLHLFEIETSVILLY